MDWKTASKDAKRRHRPYLGSNWCKEDIHLIYRDYVDSLPPTHVSATACPSQQDELAAYPFSSPLPANASASSTLPGGIVSERRNSSSAAATSLAMSEERNYLKDPLPTLPIYVKRADVPSAEAFNDFYQRYNLPVLIEGIPTSEGWSCFPQQGLEKSPWHPDNLAGDPLARTMMKCGEDDDGNTIKLPLGTFLEYLQHNKDDSPLYIFDSSSIKKQSMESGDSVVSRGYRPPTFFQEDLWSYVGDSRRPPHKWFLVGPERSGTTVHIDPLATSAWNTAIVGRKRWVIFPPETEKIVVKAAKLYAKGEDDEAANYFMKVLKRLKDTNPGIVMYEFTQNPGETLFVPSGWWHAVLNLEDTVAITQNFCSPQNFDKVWREARDGRRKTCWKWLERLVERAAPNGQALVERAHILNELDGWLPKEKRVKVSKEEKKKRKEEKKLAKKQEKKAKKAAAAAGTIPPPPPPPEAELPIENMKVDSSPQKSPSFPTVSPPAVTVSAGASDESSSSSSDSSKSAKRRRNSSKTSSEQKKSRIEGMQVCTTE
jgi:histone arginine demethylase JMJD6